MTEEPQGELAAQQAASNSVAGDLRYLDHVVDYKVAGAFVVFRQSDRVDANAE